MDEFSVEGTCATLADRLRNLFGEKASASFETCFYHFGINRFITLSRFVNDATELFLEWETENTYVAPYAAEALLEAKKQHKKLLLVSDYYFGTPFVSSLLRKKGIDMFDTYIISCEKGANKSNGTLYSYVESKAALMIGDNRISDYKIAKQNGLDAIWLDSRRHYKKYKQYNQRIDVDRQAVSLWRLRERKRLFYSCNYVYLIFEFCVRLYRCIEANDTVYFLAREGQFLKTCFDHYLMSKKRKNISTKYLLVSRLAMFNAMVEQPKMLLPHFLDVLKGYTEWQIKDFYQLLALLGLSEAEIRGIILRYGIKDPSLFGPDATRVWSDSGFQAALERKRCDASAKLIEAFPKQGGRIILVDSGWHGTMQDSLCRVLGDNYVIWGYYLGLYSSAKESEKSHKKGLIWEYVENLDRGFDRSVSTIEGLLRADHGALVCLRKDANIFRDDASLFVFQQYAKPRQQIMFRIFNQLCMRNQVDPIDLHSIDALCAKVLKIPEESAFYDRVYGNLQEKSSVVGPTPRFSRVQYVARRYTPRLIKRMLKRVLVFFR